MNQTIPATTPCDACAHLTDITDLNNLYVVRTCPKCSREVKLREPGDNGHGIKIEKGDRVVLPSGWLQFSANPLKGRGYFTRYGLELFAKQIFVGGLQKEGDNDVVSEETERFCEELLKQSTLLEGLDITKLEDAEAVWARINNDQTRLEWWAYLCAALNARANTAIAANDLKQAAWAIRASERFRAMCVFKTSFEEVVWMGHSARRLVDVIKMWDANQFNDKEEFWQQVFKDNPFVLSQLFSVPVVFIQDKAYVGGMSIDRQDAKFVDYLFASEVSHDALLVELKTPATKLLGGKYRQVYKPSPELTGAIVQAADYRRELSRNIQTVIGESGKKLDVFSPRCIVVAGNAAVELTTPSKQKSFQLFRGSLKDMEVVTYDELFAKAATLARLFNLVYEKK